MTHDPHDREETPCCHDDSPPDGGGGLLDPMNRRKAVGWLSAGLAGLAATMVGVPIVGFLFAPLIEKTPEVWRKVGPVDQFTIGETTEVVFQDPSPLPWAGQVGKRGAWLRREDHQSFVAFSINCAHLGCPVRWMADAELFMCPCHGGVYYADGKVAAGPPPRGLVRYDVRLRRGQVEIRTGPIPIT